MPIRSMNTEANRLTHADYERLAEQAEAVGQGEPRRLFRRLVDLGHAARRAP